MAPVWYYRDNCPSCKREGELHIVRRPNGRLCFRCAECMLCFDSPDDVHFIERGYRAEDEEEVVTPPSKAEIIEAGWGEYCVIEERINPKT